MFGAFAAVRFNEVIKVFFAVVVGNLVTRIDNAYRFDEDTIADDGHFAVWCTGMIHIASGIFAIGTIDRFSVAKLEKIFSGAFIRLFVGNQASGVFQNTRPSRNFFG